MPFPVPAIWTLDSADWTRDEQKREHSPASFFWSQGQALILAAGYFKNERLVTSARGGVARKHRHRIHLALFGQLMASFEYLLNDFVATVVDLLDVYDARLRKADWLELEIDRLLVQRSVQSSLGAVLIHPTLGWHMLFGWSDTP